MKRFVSPLFVAAAVLAIWATAWAQDEAGYDHEASMKEWMEKYAMPGEEHKMFEFFVGEWTYADSAFMGGQTMTSVGTVEYELAMGGRYLHGQFHGDMQGQPFEGWGISGYDRVAGEYFNLWLDNYGTGFMVATGSALSRREGYETVGEMDNPMFGGMTRYRMITEITGEDTFTFLMYMTPPGQEEMKSMVMYYTRAGS